MKTDKTDEQKTKGKKEHQINKLKAPFGHNPLAFICCSFVKHQANEPTWFTAKLQVTNSV